MPYLSYLSINSLDDPVVVLESVPAQHRQDVKIAMFAEPVKT